MHCSIMAIFVFFLLNTCYYKVVEDVCDKAARAAVMATNRMIPAYSCHTRSPRNKLISSVYERIAALSIMDTILLQPVSNS